MLDELVRDATAGDPITGLKWTRKTSRKLSAEVARRGYQVSPDTVRRLLRERHYVLRANRKRLTKEQDPERDRQMRYVARKRREFLRVGEPVISIDAKKRELVGNFKQAGRTWRPEPIDVLEYDYPSAADGIAIPYGIYDIGRERGLVIIGTTHQTPEFVIAAIRTWWRRAGRRAYPQRRRLLIEADCGGGNGNRCWLWKFGLQQLADECGLHITVTHLPTGASKWNPVEHRMFCFISQNWAGQPLVSYETVLKFIRTTKTESGFRCRALLDNSDYATGMKITREQKAQINLKPHRVLPKWNYTIEPHAIK
ncbi:MAG: ISAzo13 family transposase [Acidobacteriota bacterium]|nr:ISAzo13 family transposase [Acidobacteriota bacterium]